MVDNISEEEPTMAVREDQMVLEEAAGKSTDEGSGDEGGRRLEEPVAVAKPPEETEQTEEAGEDPPPTKPETNFPPKTTTDEVEVSGASPPPPPPLLPRKETKKSTAPLTVQVPPPLYQLHSQWSRTSNCRRFHRKPRPRPPLPHRWKSLPNQCQHQPPRRHDQNFSPQSTILRLKVATGAVLEKTTSVQKRMATGALRFLNGKGGKGSE
jgi:hypothetical protein